VSEKPQWEPDWKHLPEERLARMARAAGEIEECYRVLKGGGINIVGEVLKGQGTFYEMEHYPHDDVFDSGSFAQYYYHAHREESDEHGHFHAFVRAGGIPAAAEPAPYHGSEARPLDDEAISHLIAISMDDYGFPVGLFTVNRWVTGETWYRATDVVDLLDRFVIDHAFPSWPVNRWIGALVQLYQPQIAAMVSDRDRVVAEWEALYPDRDVYEDRDLEITGYQSIDVAVQIERVRHELKQRSALPRSAGRLKGVV